MKLNRYEKKIIKEIVESRKGIYETPKRDRLSYKPCKEYDAALSLFMKHLKDELQNISRVKNMTLLCH